MLMTSNRTEGMAQGYDRKMKVPMHRLRSSLASGVLAVLALLGVPGCAALSNSHWTGPATPAPVSSDGWQYNNDAGKVLKTPHYLIHTTISDPEVLLRLPQVLEGAYAQYQTFAVAPVTNKPMRCFVFGKRNEWADFTSRHTGSDAAIYLQITRGGYTIGDWFVSYYVGENATYSVAAHEGWHQYVARHFKGRLPPFLEEGTACMFENVKFPANLPRWDLSLNPNRTLGLRNAIENRVLWPLDKLVTMHAGDVVQLPGDKIEAFYAQNWGFARFLWEYDNGRYRESFKKLLSDTAAGQVYDPTNTLNRAGASWSPRSVRPMLEHYLGRSLTDLDVDYQQFIRKIAYEQFGKQWMSAPTG
jgi:hypothetical protein